MRWLALLLTVVLTAAACARFDDRLDDPFTPAPPPGMGAAPPSSPPDQSPPTSEPGESPPPPEQGPCVDPDPAVIATCLDPVRAVTGLGERALVAEASGAVSVVAIDAPPEDFGRVDPGDGRVVAAAASPDYAEDRLVYVLVVGDGPSRVERLARGDSPTTVAELPPASTGGLVFVVEVLTVAAGSEVVRFPDFSGIGRAERPDVVTRDVGEVHGLCTHGEDLYMSALTERGVVARTPDHVVWTWPDQQSVGGCAATDSTLSLALPDSMRVDSLPMAGGASRGQPQPVVEEDYGRITGLAAVGDGVLLGGTTNKDGGSPVETDDRVVVLPNSGDGGGDART